LKHAYVNFQRLMKISYVIFFVGLSCDRADALSQDWPCEEFYVYKTGVINDSDDEFEYSYKGENPKYIVDINLLGSHLFPNLFANCGTSGCFGTITEKSTNKSESLRFFCEEYNEDYTKVTCVIGFGNETIFDKTDNIFYTAHYCADNPDKFISLNLSDCKKCHCIGHWHNGNIKKDDGEYVAACMKEENKLRCFNLDGYLLKYFPNVSLQDYKNCIGLEL